MCKLGGVSFDLVLININFLKAHDVLTAELVKHEIILQDGEQFELNFPDEAKALVAECDTLRKQYYVASREFMICLTLQKPDSKKFQTRLLDLTSQISAHMKQPREEVVLPRLVTELQSHMGGAKKRPPASVHGGAAGEEPPAKKAKKDKTHKEKKEKKEKKTKT